MLLDADIHAEDLISVAPPNQDYQAFWRSMMRLAHELAQNNVVVVYFSTMLPRQVLANRDVLGYFESAHFLCLTCPPDVLRARLVRREGVGPVTARITGVASRFSARVKVWTDFNDALTAAASELPNATLLDASRPVDAVEHDVRYWINTHLHQPGPFEANSST